MQRPVRPMICHNDDFQHIMELRKIINYGLNEYIPSEIEFTCTVFDLAIGLKKIGVDEKVTWLIFSDRLGLPHLRIRHVSGPMKSTLGCSKLA